MQCIICGLDTGDACVPLCTLHMSLAELASDVEVCVVSDWPYTTVSHIEIMCDDRQEVARLIRLEVSGE